MGEVPLVLMGRHGAGKTTIGRLVAARLGCTFEEMIGAYAPALLESELPCDRVPGDGVEVPTRGFSIPAEPAMHSMNSIVLGDDGTHLGHARGLDAAMTAQVLGALDAGLADVAQGLLRKLLRRQLGR